LPLTRGRVQPGNGYKGRVLRLFPKWTSLAVMLAATLVGCGNDPLKSAERDPLAPPRVISLSPALTRIVVALGEQDALVGVDRFSRQLPELSDVAELGGLFATDLERSVQLDPTLVLAVGNREQQGYFDALRSRGVNVEIFEGHSLDEVLESFVRVGRLLGSEDRGRALSLQVRSKLDRIERRAPAERATIAIVVDVEPLYVVAGGSFVNELISIAGAENVFAALPTPYARVGLEALAERAPDILIDTTRPAGAAGEAEQARAHWKRFRWIQRVEFLPQGILTLPGPDLAEATAQLRQAVQPR